ncbi:MAG: FHA domain-containing protein, partial [Acutalibacteraceae bacterium]
RISEPRRTVDGHSVYSGVAYPYVEVLSGKSAGNKVKIPDYGFISIGKDPSIADLFMNDSNGISRRHCLVGYDRSKNRFIVIDRSKNGTMFSNGMRMLVDAETYLNAGDEFWVLSSDYRIKVMLE